MAEFQISPILLPLIRASIPFVIIGGHAVIYHGYVHATEVTDIIFLRNDESELSLLTALQSMGACWFSNEKDPTTGLEKLIPVSAAYIRTNHLMMLWTDLGFLEIYDFIPGFPEKPVEEVFQDAEECGGVRFVSISWLRKLKTAASRHKDLDDLEHLQGG